MLSNIFKTKKDRRQGIFQQTKQYVRKSPSLRAVQNQSSPTKNGRKRQHSPDTSAELTPKRKFLNNSGSICSSSNHSSNQTATSHSSPTSNRYRRNLADERLRKLRADLTKNIKNHDVTLQNVINCKDLESRSNYSIENLTQKETPEQYTKDKCNQNVHKSKNDCSYPNLLSVSDGRISTDVQNSCKSPKRIEPYKISVQNRILNIRLTGQYSRNKSKQHVNKNDSGGSGQKLDSISNRRSIANIKDSYQSQKQMQNRSHTSTNKQIEFRATAVEEYSLGNNQQKCSLSNLNTSAVSSSEEYNSSLNDSMEWSPIDAVSTLSNVNEICKEINYNDTSSSTVANDNSPTKVCNTEGVYVVVDTNIFLSHLALLKLLMDINNPDICRAIVVVPWMVIQELDYMKIQEEINSNGAKKAVQFINIQLNNKHPQFKGQTIIEASNCKLSSKNPDDGILFCCMQLIEQKKTVILLTDDINLRNKALIHNIMTYSHTKILEALSKNKDIVQPLAENDNICLKQLKFLITNLLNNIVDQEMLNAYGTLWTYMEKRNTSLTLEETLDILNRYWVPVFSLNIQKQCQNVIKQFSMFLKSFCYGDKSSENMNKFIEYSLSVCLYFKNGYGLYRDQIEKCIANIQKCAR